MCVPPWRHLCPLSSLETTFEKRHGERPERALSTRVQLKDGGESKPDAGSREPELV
jgi:hypothetical protein